jgi:hypothetical protein
VEGIVTDSGKEKELLLIGTVHRDPDGAVKLRRLLAKERPTAVAVEVSPYGLFYRQRNGRRLRRCLKRNLSRVAEPLRVSWRRWGQIHAIEAQFLMPFEYRGALNYCRDSTATLSCLDSSHWSRSLIQAEWQQLLSRDNLAALLQQFPENLRKEVRKGYQLAAYLLSDRGKSLASAFAQGWSADANWQQREAELARRLRTVYGRLRNGRLAYVGGWQHLLGLRAGTTLFERLEHLRPRRVLLNEGAGAE